MAFQATASPPALTDPSAARREVKQKLAAAFRIFAKLGFNEGVAGHITARDPEAPDCFWVNPFGRSFAQMRAADLSLVRHDGTLIQGEAVNAAAFAIHSAIHRARPDVVCAAHGHPLYGKSWSALGRLLDPINQDVCALHGDHVLFPEATGIVADVGEGERIAACLGAHKAIILRNHGLLTVGATVDAAVWWFVLMERSCQAQLLAEAAGQPMLIPSAEAAGIAAAIGTPDFGWFQFQPLYAQIVAEQPELLEE